MQVSLPSSESETLVICFFPHRYLKYLRYPCNQAWTEFKKRYLFTTFCKQILLPLLLFFIFFFFLFPSFLCVLMHSNTRLSLKHSSFVYLSIPITDLCLSGCSDHTFPCDHSLQCQGRGISASCPLQGN